MWLPYRFLTLLLIGVSLWIAIVFHVNIDWQGESLIILNKFAFRLAFRNTPTENDMEFHFDYDALLTPLNIEKSKLIALPYVSGNTLRGLADHMTDDAVCINLRNSARLITWLPRYDCLKISTWKFFHSIL